MVVLLDEIPAMEMEVGPSKHATPCDDTATPADESQTETEKKPKDPSCPRCTYLQPGTRFKGNFFFWHLSNTPGGSLCEP